MTPVATLLTAAHARYSVAVKACKLGTDYWQGVKNGRYLVVFHSLFEGEIDDSYPVTALNLASVAKLLADGPDQSMLPTTGPNDWKADIFDLNSGEQIKWTREFKIKLARPVPEKGEEEESGG